MNIMYWNTNGGPLDELIAVAVNEHDIDILILSEYSNPSEQLLRTVNAPLDWKHILHFSPVDDPIFVSRLPAASIKVVHDEPGISVRRIVPPVGTDFLLAAIHLPSKMYYEEADQHQLAIRIARIIGELEAKHEHRKTLIVGDFNMNPFEHGVVGFEGFHAVSSRTVANRKSRTVAGRTKGIFYNPMWSHFGDFPSPPPGTYFYREATPIAHFWHMFDQVIVGSGLLSAFNDDSLRILTEIGSQKLTRSNGLPDRTHGSDHLPIVFGLDLLREELHDD